MLGLRSHLVACACVTILLHGCVTEGPAPGGDATVPPTTKVLDDGTFAVLESVSPDLATLHFNGKTAQLDALQAGDVLVSTVRPPLLPYGALRRVESVSPDGSGVTVTTAQASLAEAVQDGELATRFPLRQQDIADTTKLIRNALGPGQLIFPIDHVVLFDGDGDKTATTNDQVILDGNLALDPEVIIDIQIAGFSLKKVAIEIQGEVTANITLEARREASPPPYKETLLTVPFNPIVIPLGPIPVVLVPVLEIEGGADGSFSAGTTANLTLNADTRVGMKYDGKFGPVLEVKPSGTADVTKFVDGGKAAGKVWIGAKFKVGVYGLAGVFVESRFYGWADMDAAACPWWKLYAGVEGLAGAFAEINIDFLIFDVHIKLFEWATDPLSKEVPVADAGGCAPSSVASGLDTLNWARSYGADNLEFPVALATTPDGGAIVAGTTYSYTPQPDAWLLKIDALGHAGWQLGYDDLDAAIAVRPVADGYFMLAGEVSYSAFLTPPFVPEALRKQAGDPPSYLLRLDKNGSPLWAKAIASAEALDASAMGLLLDGDVVLAGIVGDPPDGQDVWVSRFTASGELVWTRRLNGGKSEEVQAMIVDSDGNIVVVATSKSFTVDGCDWTIKLDPAGNVLWQACYDGPHNDWVSAVVQTATGYEIVGHLNTDAQINRIDKQGNLVNAWHVHGGTEYDEAYSAAGMPNGDLVLAGKTGLGDGSDLWLARLGSDQKVQWTRTYGGARSDSAGGFNQYARLASAVAPTADGGTLVAGCTASFSHAPDNTGFDLDLWILKVRGVGTIDFDAASGASSHPTAGLSAEAEHHRIATAAPAVPLDLIVADFTPVMYSTHVDVTRQGGPE